MLKVIYDGNVPGNSTTLFSAEWDPFSYNILTYYHDSYSHS